MPRAAAGLPEQNFVDALLELSRRLCAVPREHRQAMLQRALDAVNCQLADGLWLPTAPDEHAHHRTRGLRAVSAPRAVPSVRVSQR